MVKWKLATDTSDRRYGIEDVIRLTIEDAPDYHAGEFEIVKARLDKLVDIVAKAVALMPNEVQYVVVDENCYQFIRTND